MMRRRRLERERREALSSDLRAVALRGRRHVRRRRVMEAFPAALEWAFPLLFVSAGGILAFRAVLWMSGATAPFAPGLLVLVMLLPYALAVTVRVAKEVILPVEDDAAFGVIDRSLHLKDRMAAAADFLERDATSPFMEAAIEDARLRLDLALHAELPSPQPVVSMHSRRWGWAVGAAALLALAFLIPVGTKEATHPAAFSAPVVASGPLSKDENERGAKETPAATEKEPPRPALRTPSMQRSSEGKESSDSNPEGRPRRTMGPTKSGEAARAGAPTGGAEARGEPSDQGRPAKGAGKPKTRRPKRPGSEKPAKRAKKKPVEDPSGATMGQGASGGANRNPVASEWSSKDKVPPGVDQPADEDEDVDDESEAEKARGGLQPHLRDRRPPPSRDLGVGFGNQSGGDGRGGPGQRKKSRGTASLVLGVPIPDHVKGQVNPGTTKITQERVEPQPEDAPRSRAMKRDPRKGAAASRWPRPWTPWTGRWVKRWFESLRSKEKGRP
ncbi:MAG TPA: hypothetical protein ENK43_04910 [Planctomycetes bacterium]|nr:hypothetical protein [Planctomycetota bacterium]